MNREPLINLLNSPQRRLIVIFGTFAIGVVAILPLVDNYKERVGELARLGSELEEATHEVTCLEEYQQKRNAAVSELATFQKRVVQLKEASDYHRHIVDLARQTNCHVARISADEVQSRPWIEGDDPLSRRRVKKSDAPTPYDLVSQRVSLSIRGLPLDIDRFLKLLHEENKISHTTHFSIHPANSERESVVLELDFLLLSLERKLKPNEVANRDNSRAYASPKT